MLFNRKNECKTGKEKREECETSKNTEIKTVKKTSYNNNNWSILSHIYIVKVDGKNIVGTSGEHEAKMIMWELAQKLNLKYESPYKTNYFKVQKNCIHLMGSDRFSLVFYDKILHEVSYEKIINRVPIK